MTEPLYAQTCDQSAHHLCSVVGCRCCANGHGLNDLGDPVPYLLPVEVTDENKPGCACEEAPCQHKPLAPPDIRERIADAVLALPYFVSLRQKAAAYDDAVLAWMQVSGGGPLSTTVGYLIRTGLLVFADPQPTATERAENWRKPGRTEQR